MGLEGKKEVWGPSWSFFLLSNDQAEGQGRAISAENVVGSGSDTELCASRTTAATSVLQVTGERSEEKK